MLIKDIMTTRVVTIEQDDSLRVVQGILKNVDFHHLLVTHNKKLVGIISDRDFLRELSPFLNTFDEAKRDRFTLDKKAHQVMTRAVICVHKDTRIETAVELLLENKISCLPVTTPDGKIEGIVTWEDFLKFFLKK